MQGEDYIPLPPDKSIEDRVPLIEQLRRLAAAREKLIFPPVPEVRKPTRWELFKAFLKGRL